jgi:hypothetical protein
MVVRGLVGSIPNPTSPVDYSLTTVWKLTDMLDMSIICMNAPATSMPRSAGGLVALSMSV